ncbi:MAG: hypothetical protein GF353_18360 [Candidatus Lokiarchaeota archaeon]|nr:hypothetical protein [Candidatus Lokiarchaeota archaeon]
MKFNKMLIICVLVSILHFNYVYSLTNNGFIVVPIESKCYSSSELNEVNNYLISKLRDLDKNNFRPSHEIYKQVGDNDKLMKILRDPSQIKQLSDKLNVRYIITSYITKIDKRLALSITIYDTKNGAKKYIAADRKNYSTKNFKKEIIPTLAKQINKYCKNVK